MNRNYFDQATRLLGALLFQTVPPSALVAYSGYELARFSGISFGQAVGIVTSSLIICMMVHTVRDY